ncbi:probable exopolysaccharide synthesis protein [Hahella chejuensis KCTC 2396]|uniref:Probable exopolysaccharide synthesis protein n=1 Tax=Hahella chejuensis (strain KCTC 2396) TaxID=349521 RepID=Q2SIH3_HAHCH|nr:exopolysaccharide biosynthesis protein [Hahella chejuensis]ABC29551.1 probable exopolysaccharide synthesis protein [Hahella chejuensis KCTC 2396]
MAEDDKPHNLTQMLDRLEERSLSCERVSIETVLEVTGRRSFGPILLLAGLIPASPLSGVPGLPTLTALVVLPVIIQLLLGRRYFWQPSWVLRRSIDKDRFMQALNVLRKPALWVDRYVHPRLQVLTKGAAVYLVAIVCLGIIALMPPLELAPFANSLSGAALSLFGLALISHDGLLVLIGLILCGVTVALMMYTFSMGM